MLNNTRCTECQSRINPGQKFCSQCGTKVPKVKPGTIVYNVISAWKGRSVYCTRYAYHFGSLKEVLDVLDSKRDRSSDCMDLYIIGFHRADYFCGNVVITASMRQIQENGELGSDQGVQELKLTNLE